MRLVQLTPVHCISFSTKTKVHRVYFKLHVLKSRVAYTLFKVPTNKGNFNMRVKNNATIILLLYFTTFIINTVLFIKSSYAVSLVSSVDIPSAQKVYAENDYCYVTTSSNIYIVDITNFKKPYILSQYKFLKYDGFNEINQLYVKDSFALISDTRGLNIIDFSSITNPTLASELYLSYGYNSSFTENYAYIPSDDGLEVIDITDLYKPKVVQQFSSYYITAVYVNNNFAYVINSNNFSILNINDLNNIKLEGEINDISLSYYSSIIAKNNYVYLTNTDESINKLFIINVTDPALPIIESKLNLPNNYHNKLSILENEILYMSNQKEGVFFIDINDKSNPTILDCIGIDNGAEDFYMQDHLYFIANGDGLHIFYNPISKKPVAITNQNQKVEEGKIAYLDASKSFSPEDEIVKYTWDQVSGIEILKSTSNSINLTFVCPEIENEIEILEFCLCVTDSNGLTDCDSAIVYLKKRPDGIILMYSDMDGDFDIFEINSNGTIINQLTKNEDDDKFAKYSKDGKKILFIKNGTQIWMIDRNSDHEQYITDGTSADFVNNNTIVLSKYYGSGYFTNQEIFLFDINNNTLDKISDNVTEDMNIDISINNMIAFVGKFMLGIKYANLYISDIYGSNIQELTNFSEYNTAFSRTPYWSPDGTKIIFSLSKKADSNSSLYIFDISKTEIKSFASSSSASIESPVWSIGGDYIVCSYNGRILRVNLDLSEQYYLTSENFINSYPSDWEIIVDNKHEVQVDINCDNKINLKDAIHYNKNYI